MTALDGVRTLIDTYGVPYDRIIALSHHELDIRMLIEQKGIEVFEKFANYGVVSEFVYCASLMKGVARVPWLCRWASISRNFTRKFPSAWQRWVTLVHVGQDLWHRVEARRTCRGSRARGGAGVQGGRFDRKSNIVSRYARLLQERRCSLTSSISEAAQIARHGSRGGRQARDRHSGRTFSAQGLSRRRHPCADRGRKVQGLHRRRTADITRKIRRPTG